MLWSIPTDGDHICCACQDLIMTHSDISKVVFVTELSICYSPNYTYTFHFFYDVNCCIGFWRVIKVMAGAGGILMGHREGLGNPKFIM